MVSQHDLYPTIGMQTIGEVVDTNFGQEPFAYTIEDEIKVLIIVNLAFKLSPRNQVRFK